VAWQTLAKEGRAWTEFSTTRLLIMSKTEKLDVEKLSPNTF
jgi:hypothetical protein